MSRRPPEGTENELRSIFLKDAKKHLDKASDYIEYARTNGQANVQVDGFVGADSALARAKEQIDAAKDCITRATEAP